MGRQNDLPKERPWRWLWLWKLLADLGRTILAAVRTLLWCIRHGDGPRDWFS